MPLKLKKPTQKTDPHAVQSIAPAPVIEPNPAAAVQDDPDALDIRLVDVDSIEPNDWNPNDMEAEFFEAIVAQIKAEGMVQPVLVFPKPGVEGRYIIADGEHRWKGSKIAGRKKIHAVVVPYDEQHAKVKTIAMNNLRGQNIPIKLARLLVDLHSTYSKEEIRRLTGISEDDQASVLSLLEIPDFKPGDGIKLTAQDVDRPISVSLMLMPDEHGAYTTAMKKAMKISGDDVTALIGHEVASYDQAMKAAMGIAGAKLRNVALALICETFNTLPSDMKADLAAAAHKKIYDKLASDAQAKEDKKAKSDKKSG